MTGFIQMGIGAVARQLSSHVIRNASDAMPMLWLMLAFGLALAAAFLRAGAAAAEVLSNARRGGGKK